MSAAAAAAEAAAGRGAEAFALVAKGAAQEARDGARKIYAQNGKEKAAADLDKVREAALRATGACTAAEAGATSDPVDVAWVSAAKAHGDHAQRELVVAEARVGQCSRAKGDEHEKIFDLEQDANKASQEAKRRTEEAVLLAAVTAVHALPEGDHGRGLDWLQRVCALGPCVVPPDVPSDSLFSAERRDYRQYRFVERRVMWMVRRAGDRGEHKELLPNLKFYARANPRLRALASLGVGAQHGDCRFVGFSINKDIVTKNAAGAAAGGASAAAAGAAVGGAAYEVTGKSAIHDFDSTDTPLPRHDVVFDKSTVQSALVGENSHDKAARWIAKVIFKLFKADEGLDRVREIKAAIARLGEEARPFARGWFNTFRDIAEFADLPRVMKLTGDSASDGLLFSVLEAWAAAGELSGPGEEPTATSLDAADGDLDAPEALHDGEPAATIPDAAGDPADGVADVDSKVLYTLLNIVKRNTIRGVKIFDLMEFLHLALPGGTPVAIVGGAVRDVITGEAEEKIHDIDLAVGRTWYELEQDIERFFSDRDQALTDASFIRAGKHRRFGMMKIETVKPERTPGLTPHNQPWGGNTYPHGNTHAHEKEAVDIGLLKAARIPDRNLKEQLVRRYEACEEPGVVNPKDQIYLFGRAPGSDPYTQDADYRDYSINAIYADLFAWKIYDPRDGRSCLRDPSSGDPHLLQFVPRTHPEFIPDVGGRVRLFKMLTKRTDNGKYMYDVEATAARDICAALMWEALQVLAFVKNSAGDDPRAEDTPDYAQLAEDDL